MEEHMGVAEVWVRESKIILGKMVANRLKNNQKLEEDKLRLETQ